MKRERKRVFTLSDCVVTYERKGDVQSRIIVCTDGAEFRDVAIYDCVPLLPPLVGPAGISIQCVAPKMAPLD